MDRRNVIEEFATHRVLRPIKIDTKYFEPGDQVALSDEHAEELALHVEPLTEEEQETASVVELTPAQKAAATRAAKKAAEEAAKAAAEEAEKAAKEGE